MIFPRTSRIGKNHLPIDSPIHLNISTRGLNTAVSAGSSMLTNPSMTCSIIFIGFIALLTTSNNGCNAPTHSMTPLMNSFPTADNQFGIDSPNMSKYSASLLNSSVKGVCIEFSNQFHIPLLLSGNTAFTVSVTSLETVP